MFYNICHDKDVHYDIVSNLSVHRCRVCGKKWRCVLPPIPVRGEKYVPEYWVRRRPWMLLGGSTVAVTVLLGGLLALLFGPLAPVGGLLLGVSVVAVTILLGLLIVLVGRAEDED